jgi:hypothetical protein
MKKIDLVYPSVRAIGYARDNRAQCSLLGEASGMPLGPVAWIHPGGVKLRTNVEFPLAMGTTFVAVER